MLLLHYVLLLVLVSLVAEMFGFKDPVEMINALVDMRPMKEVVMERTDQRMLNEFSNLTDPRRQELQVQEAILDTVKRTSKLLLPTKKEER